MTRSWGWFGALIAAIAFSACGGGGGTDSGEHRNPPVVENPQGNNPPVTHPPVVVNPPTTNPPPVVNPPEKEPPKPIDFPQSAGWTFFGPQHGGPSVIFDVTTDADGNVWVAGGEDGLFLLRPNAQKFERFTLKDGLRPYGYLPDGRDADTPDKAYLKVISVEGGPSKDGRRGVVFVGYAGKPGPRGEDDCETNWDWHTKDPNHVADPSIYKSGDADRVELEADGSLHVVHYDIFSGPGRIDAEPEGRERLCHVKRLAYDAATNSIWFGANHGNARGVANYEPRQSCFPHGPYDRSRPNDPMYFNWGWSTCGVDEHAHPIVANNNGDLAAGDWFGVAVDPTTGDVWFGSTDVSTKFRYNTYNQRYFDAQVESEFDTAYHFDIWPGVVDGVTDMVADGDTVWVASNGGGVARLGPQGQVIDMLDAHDGLDHHRTRGTVHIRTVARDSRGALWMGYAYMGWVAKYDGGPRLTHLPFDTFGETLSALPIARITTDRFGGQDRVIVGFGYEVDPRHPPETAAIAIYRPPAASAN